MLFVLGMVCEGKMVRNGKKFWVYVLLAGTLPATNSKEGLRPVLFRPLGVARDKQRVIGTAVEIDWEVCCRGKQVVAAVRDR